MLKLFILLVLSPHGLFSLFHAHRDLVHKADEKTKEILLPIETAGSFTIGHSLALRLSVTDVVIKIVCKKLKSYLFSLGEK